MPKWIRIFSLLFYCLFLRAAVLPAQSGCTDPQALNYDPNATLNDGSCEYPPTSYQPVLLAGLSDALDEISGLGFFSTQLWGQTDSFNPQKVYQLHPQSGAILHETLLVSSINTDWEDLATDGSFLYVGDFGNNDGNRTDLKIYKVPLAELSQNAATTEVIAFAYEDQTDFQAAPAQNNFDCEAFFFADDSLHLFTKRWLDQKTYHYVLPAQAGNYTALLRDSFDVQTLITGADIDSEGHIALLGLAPITQEAVLWLLYDYPPGHFFSGNKRRISLGSPFTVGQLEGICFSAPWEGYLAAERFAQLPAQLHRFQLQDIITSTSPFSERLSANAVRVSPNPFTENIKVEWSKPVHIQEINLINANGTQTLHWSYSPHSTSSLWLEMPAHLPKGFYFLHIEYAAGKQEVVQVNKE